ncbi:MAG: hypothetical protein R3F49_04030 [Planctomycetota bacterium]
MTAVHTPRDRAAFDRFVRLCAARTGQLLVMSELAPLCAVDEWHTPGLTPTWVG